MVANVLTLRFVDSSGKKLRDLEISADVPIERMLSSILTTLGLEAPGEWNLWLGETQIDLRRSFADAGVRSASIIVVRRPVDQWRVGPVKANAPMLLCPGGPIVIINTPTMLIGRATPDHQPDIDLAPVDPKQVVSRQHAWIKLQGEQCVLLAEPTRNGTYVNDRLLLPHETYILQSGDVIRLGRHGPELVFRSPNEASQ